MAPFTPYFGEKMPVTSILITKRLGNGDAYVQVVTTSSGQEQHRVFLNISRNQQYFPFESYWITLYKLEKGRESERDIQNAQPPPPAPSSSLPNSPTFGAFTTPARNGDSIDLIRRGGRGRAGVESGVSFGGGDFITDAFGAATKATSATHKKPTTVMALNQWMEKEGRKNECATYAGDSPDFSAEVEREPEWGFRAILSHPAPRGRKDVALPISPRDNERAGAAGGCHLVWDRKSSSERPAGDYDDKIVIIAALLLLLAVVSLLPSSCQSWRSVRPHLGVKPRRRASRRERERERERAAFFRGKPPLRKIISGDTIPLFSADSVASSGGTEPCDRQTQRQPCGDRRRLCRRPPAPVRPPSTFRSSAVKSFIIQLRGRNFFSE